MKTLTMPEDLTKLEGFPYRLTHYFKDKRTLDSIIAQFTLHNCEHRAVIVSSGAGWSVYTDGKDLIRERYRWRI